jgi:hypothetical protein
MSRPSVMTESLPIKNGDMRWLDGLLWRCVDAESDQWNYEGTEVPEGYALDMKRYVVPKDWLEYERAQFKKWFRADFPNRFMHECDWEEGWEVLDLSSREAWSMRHDAVRRAWRAWRARAASTSANVAQGAEAVQKCPRCELPLDRQCNCDAAWQARAAASATAPLTSERETVLLESAVDLMKRLKRDLMHARRFGSDTLAAYRRACSSAEGDVEEWLIENSRAQSTAGEPK